MTSAPCLYTHRCHAFSTHLQRAHASRSARFKRSPHRTGGAPSPGPVEPMTHECATDYRTRVRVDGRSHDWEDEVGTTFRVDQLIAGDFRFDWTGPNDASFLLWCRQDKENLYFAIVGRDNIIVEPKGDKKGDRFEFWFEVQDARIPTRSEE